MTFETRGYRSNQFLEAVRPDVHLKQKWFLGMEQLEIMYGGAAGGGKSDALLMAALQYVDIPHYAAIIFRRTYADLALAGALMDRATRWLSKTNALKRDGGKKWEFPGGGTLEFGYLDKEDDKYRYQSAEFQFVGFDELTQMPEDAYSYLFSRLRRPAEATCIDCDGKGKSGRLRCLSCAGSGQNPLASVPLRMRSATNPGGKYGEWVRAAFISKRYMQTPEADQFSKIWGKSAGCILCKGEGKILVREILTPCSACGGSGKTKRYFVPARLEDNPSVDILSYEAALAKLTAQERAQLRHGRWDIVADGLLFKSGWFRRYYFRGEILVLQTPVGEKFIDSTKWFTFITADTASTVKSTSDYTVVCVWAYVEDTADICLVDVYRDKIPIPHILPAVRKMYEEWGCLHAIIENASSGIGVLQEVWLTQRGGNMNVIPFSPHNGDKVSRATEATILAEAGKIYIPQQKVMADDDTLTDCFNELLQFDGADGSAHDDFVDNVSMAAWWAAKRHRDRQPSGGQGPGQMWRPGMPLVRPRFSAY